MRPLLALLLGVAALAAPALSQTPREPLAAVRADADGDLVPDRLGESVAVAGRASVSQGTYGTATSALYLQDATAGIELSEGVLTTTARRVGAGDSLLVTGVVRFRNGTTYLEPTALERVAAAPRIPAPVPYDPARAEALEGQLVEATGVVVGKSQVTVGRALMVSLHDLSLVVVFAFDDQPDAVSFEDLEAGERIRVTGVAGQYDRAAPYADSYQIYPRSQDDLHLAGVPPSVYRWVALGAVALLLLALGAAAILRRQVRRRVAALRASEDRYRTLMDRASDAVIVHDLEGEEVEANLAARAMLNLGATDAVPRLRDLITPTDRPTLDAHLRRLRETGNARTDLRLATFDSKKRLLEVESQVVEVDGVQRVLSLGRDVAARRAYERVLIEAREDAEETARVKSAFLASMSHEIRTPLTAVIGFAELLMDEVEPEARGLVQAIDNGGRRLLSTLNSVLDLARLDAHREALHPAPLDVVAHVTQSLDLLRPLAEEQALRLTVSASADAIPAVLDEGALDRVLTNLVGNAIKFTEHGGVTVELDADDHAVVLRVIDTGIGIADDFLPELFTEFRQQSEGDARSHEGTGLGLAITKRLVELMGGTIAVDSQWGVGTAFAVTIPRGLEPGGDGAVPMPEVAARATSA